MTRLTFGAMIAALVFVGSARSTPVRAANPPTTPPGVTSPWLFTGSSKITQNYGCSALSAEPLPPDGRCNGNPNGARWHTGLDIAGGSVVCGTVFRVGQLFTAKTVSITSSFSVIEGLLGDQNYLVIYHAQTAYVTGGRTYNLGASMGAVGKLGNATGCHIHFEIDGPKHTVGKFQDWTDIDPWFELSGNESSRTLSGDFNGDGYTDLAGAYYGGGTTTSLYVWLGNAGGFQPAARWWSGTTFDWKASKIVAGNFNGDAYSDVAVLYNYGPSTAGIWVWLGSSSGFQAPSRWWYNTGWSWKASTFTAGDFNGDGNTDIAIFYNYGSTTSAIWLIRSAATSFMAPARVWYSTGFAWDASKVVTADFNGDAYSDFAVLYNYGGTTSGIWVWLGSASPFQAPTRWWYATSFDWMQSKVVAGNFNGAFAFSSRAPLGDFAVLYNYGGTTTKLWVWRGLSGSGFQPASAWWTSTTFSWMQTKLAAGNFNGDSTGIDGAPVDDLALLSNHTNNNTDLWLVPGQTSSTFGTPVKAWNSTGWSWDYTKLS